MAGGFRDLFALVLGWRSVATATVGIAPWPRHRRYEYAVEFESPDGEVYTPAWVEGLAWSTYYGSDGSGYGALSVTFARQVGFDYADLAFSFGVRVRYGLETVLFDGQVRQIKEGVRGGIHTITVTALGWGVVCGDDKLNWVFAEKRYGAWTVDPEPDGSYRPDRFSGDQNDRLLLAMRNNEFYEQNDYVAMRYTLPTGQSITRFSASWELNVPDDFGGSVELTVVTSAAETLLTQTTDGSGAVDENIAVGAPTWIEFRLESTASDGTCYSVSDDEDGLAWATLTDATVYAGETDDVTALHIFQKLVEVMSADDHGLSDDVDDIADPGLVLEPAIFESDQALEEIAKWAASFGDANGLALAWGIRFDDSRTVFLESIDRANVAYSVRRDAQMNAETSGDWQGSHQQLYGRYKDADGNIVRTSDVEDAVTIEALGGYARRSELDVSVTTDASVVASILALAIAEKGPIATKSSLSVAGFVQTANGGEMFAELLQAGKMISIEDFRAREAALSGGLDLSDTFTTGLAAIVEVDAKSHEVRVVLESETETLARYLAVLGGLRNV